MVHEKPIIGCSGGSASVSESVAATSMADSLVDPHEGNYLALTKEEIGFIQVSFLRKMKSFVVAFADFQRNLKQRVDGDSVLNTLLWSVSQSECNRNLNVALISYPSPFKTFRAAQTVDVGAELIKRLLNDKRSLFKALLESQCGAMEIDKFTVDDINNRFPRAKQVGEGVVKFFTKVVEVLPDYNSSLKIREMSINLGILHYKMKVWFQAENWLCVKNSLLEVVVDITDSKTSISRQLFGRCAGDNVIDIRKVDKNAQRAAWTKVIQFVIRNMKRGFLSEALRANKPRNYNISPKSDKFR